MGLSLTTLEGFRDKLVAALASGTRVVSYRDDEGQSVSEEYRSVAEIQAALSDVERRIAVLRGQHRVSRIQFVASKGL